MCVETREDLLALKEAGRIVRRTLLAMKREVRPGITTERLDEVAARTLRENGAHSAPNLVLGFPGAACISVNDEVVHGVPSRRVI